MDPGPTSVRFLGVLLDSKLTWEAHIESVCKKLKSNIFALRGLAGVVTGDVLRTAYFALVHSLLTYAVLVWGHAADWGRVFALQRRAVRIVAGLGYRDDCVNSFVELGILTFPNLYILENVLYVKNNLDRYPTNSSFHNYDTRHGADLATPWMRVGRCRNGPNILAVHFFNRLPGNVRDLELKTFKRVVKGFLLHKPFYSTQEYLTSDSLDLIGKV